mgnify:CR=1 FL=1
MPVFAFFIPGGMSQKSANLLTADLTAEDQKRCQLNGQKSRNGKANSRQRKCELMSDDSHTNKLGSHKTDEFRKQHRNRKSNDQCQDTAQKILRKKHDKELASAHPHHQIDTELFSAAFQADIYRQNSSEKQDPQCHHIENRNHQQQPAYRITLHFRKKNHHILLGEGRGLYKKPQWK